MIINFIYLALKITEWREQLVYIIKSEEHFENIWIKLYVLSNFIDYIIINPLIFSNLILSFNYIIFNVKN